MLEYDFTRVMKARGIDKPFKFLRQAGFSANFASKIKNNRVLRLTTEQLEKLCLLFKCTPNDLMVWTPTDSAHVDDHPLHKIRKSDVQVDMLKTINSIPLEHLSRINQLIKSEIEKSDG
ncbi:helix-turn-helix domain-containing protein [Carboxylicivirga marina]|uniref:Helix-turn-helix transcriptional regulator n=1 Tax=Carboxylicivirga marina TaxID=2800988 RepID=A0ABS1HG11_9BACT|nr:helix-turn-helix transcriptional regulator [Carboxylicivirga marina]MBK3516581.1 helix-turn-helix transcriptional regulator [Carboxylicivirga marina]